MRRHRGLIGGSRHACIALGRAPLSALLALCTVAVALILPSTPALALSERGHVFTSSFGSAGGEAGQFSRPAGVAVNESTGDVYVVDRGNQRVERFDAGGKFISAWGYDVGKATKERKGAAFEVCTTKCFPGLGGGATAKGQLNFPEGIAVDNSSSASAGDVYVVVAVESEQSYVAKFSANGTFLRRVTKKEETESFPGGRIDGLAVDAHGTVWVEWSEEEVTTFNANEPNKRVSEEEIELETEFEPNTLRPGFAVDSQDNLYTNYEPSGQFVEAEESEGEELVRHEEGRSVTGGEPCEGEPCVVNKLTGIERPELELDSGRCPERRVRRWAGHLDRRGPVERQRLRHRRERGRGVQVGRNADPALRRARSSAGEAASRSTPKPGPSTPPTPRRARSTCLRWNRRASLWSRDFQRRKRPPTRRNSARRSTPPASPPNTSSSSARHRP